MTFAAITGSITGTVAALTALAYAYQRWVKPVVQAAKLFIRFAPVALKVAAQFEKNGGSSLLDKINGMSDDIKQIASDTNTAKETAAKADKSSSEASAAASEAREAVKALKTDFADVKAHLGRQDEMMKKAMPPGDVNRGQT